MARTKRIIELDDAIESMRKRLLWVRTDIENDRFTDAAATTQKLYNDMAHLAASIETLVDRQEANYQLAKER